MKQDNCISFAIPALSLGYAVVNDKNGRLRFYTDEVNIYWRDNVWLMITDGQIFEFESLENALIGGEKCM